MLMQAIVPGHLLFKELHKMSLQFKTCDIFGTPSKPYYFLPTRHTSCPLKSLVVAVTRANRANARKESAKSRNRRIQKKFNGAPTKPRLSVFCSDKQLYAMLVDDQNKKRLYYGSTLQKSIRGDPPCTTIEAAERVGEELIKACIDQNIDEISYYDRNGFARGEKMQAFEIAISRHGLLPG
ncbi:Ribosomal_L18p domain-containing protein [Cephalotus follicularis]|uniref:Ribosomal_L18p domain-containing protein n=1 Tax=Cephalotus follicularis TaxID=3775 RepID=A0A1Q3BPH7_CEPFO|nr:Ribosomal_L18p domain-containing protein [Cephalotus follicularis]